jgi:hypothetical protein
MKRYAVSIHFHRLAFQAVIYPGSCFLDPYFDELRKREQSLD